MKRCIIGMFACCWLAAGLGLAQQQAPPKPKPKPKPAGGASCPAGGANKSADKKKRPKVDPAKRAAAIQTLCDRLSIGEGRVIADVGCGKKAPDTMTFAGVVGSSGKVYGEEITQESLDALTQKAKESGLDHIVPVLGNSEDPCLPDAAIDLIYMHHVFHHFAKPGSMLAHFRTDLKPGGYLAIVDRERGPQRVWPDMASREKKHFWTGETTVVRLAREAGLHFHAEFDDVWPDEKAFVLVFRRPEAAEGPPGDPDLPAPLDAKAAVAELPPVGADRPQVLFVGLDRGRALLPGLREMAGSGSGSGSGVLDVVLEEWRAFDEELPPDARSDSEEIVRAVNGDVPELAGDSLDAVVFADGYSRLWDPAPLLRRLHAALKPAGYVAVLDRVGPEEKRRSLAGHHRRISPDRVKADMQAAGFECVKALKAPAEDRFFLLFRCE